MHFRILLREDLSSANVNDLKRRSGLKRFRHMPSGSSLSFSTFAFSLAGVNLPVSQMIGFVMGLCVCEVEAFHIPALSFYIFYIYMIVIVAFDSHGN